MERLKEVGLKIAPTAARIRQEIPDDVGRLTLRQQHVDEVLTCGGLWQGQEVATKIGAHVFI